MKRDALKGLSLLLALFLTGCFYQRHVTTEDFTHETWQREVATHPNKLARGADTWFWQGNENSAEEMARNAPASAAISTMMVRVPNSFTNIKVMGQFQVQIFGTNDNNSVYVYGPNAAVRAVGVRVTNHTLYLTQAKEVPPNLGCVIVRVGIKNLKLLEQMGPGSIEGRLLRSDGLCVLSSGSGHVYLAGQMHLQRVMTRCAGNVTILGANTSRLLIVTAGAGSVNVSGRVGVKEIQHHGSGDINIIGANSDQLMIRADGKGKIGIEGQVAMRSIDVGGCVAVYAYYVNSAFLKVRLTDHARVGLAGCVRNLNVDANKQSFFGGRYLYATDAYVRVGDTAYANVVATNKAFIAAGNSSSVNFYGSPAILTQFVKDYGVVMPMMEEGGCWPRAGYCPYRKQGQLYKD